MQALRTAILSRFESVDAGNRSLKRGKPPDDIGDCRPVWTVREAKEHDVSQFHIWLPRPTLIHSRSTKLRFMKSSYGIEFAPATRFVRHRSL
jgi:hypothetical protein